MTYCPSQDWDRYVDLQDEETAREVAWWANPHHQLLVATILSGNVSRLFDENGWDNGDAAMCLERAAALADLITQRGIDPSA